MGRQLLWVHQFTPFNSQSKSVSVWWLYIAWSFYTLRDISTTEESDKKKKKCRLQDSSRRSGDQSTAAPNSEAKRVTPIGLAKFGGVYTI